MGEVALGETNPVAMAPIATAAVPVIHNQVSFIHTDNVSFNQNCYREFFPQGNSPNCNHCPNMGFLGASATRISPIETRGNEKDDWWDRLCPTLCGIFKP